MEQSSKCCTKCHTFKPLAEFSKCRKGLQPKCKQCDAEYRKQNADKIAEYYKQNAKKFTEYYKQNAERIAEYRKQNAERFAEYQAEYYKQNAERIAEYRAEYCKNNLEARAALAAKRRAKKIQATPPWLCELHLKQIQQFYTEAARLTKETGVKYHVDHIIPLQGREVRGLHVPWNLQVIPAVENLSKGNRITA